MSPRAAFWSATYAADRRRHRHRCACGCNSIVQPGEQVFMARVSDRVTRVVRADHAEAVCDGFTALERLEAWGMCHLADCGWAHAKAFVETADICAVGGVEKRVAS